MVKHLFITGHVWSFNQSETQKSGQDVGIKNPHSWYLRFIQSVPQGEYDFQALALPADASLQTFLLYTVSGRYYQVFVQRVWLSNKIAQYVDPFRNYTPLVKYRAMYGFYFGVVLNSFSQVYHVLWRNLLKARLDKASGYCYWSKSAKYCFDQ